MHENKSKDVYEILAAIKKCFILEIMRLSRNTVMVQMS